MDNGMICKLEAEIEEYEKQIKKLEAVIEYLHRDMDSLRMRCKPGIEKYFDRKSYGMIMIVGCNEEVRDANALRAENESLKQRIAELESGERVDLPFDPLECANYIINATYERETSSLERTFAKVPDKVNSDRYTVDDLEQIAEHLLVYCKHNKESE